MIFTRYVLIQIIAVLANLLIFIISMNFVSNEIYISNTLAILLSGLLAFYLHRRFTFEVALHSKITWQRLKYFISLVAYIPISSACITIIGLFLNSDIMSKLLCDSLLLVFSYNISKRAIFSIKQHP